MDGEYPHEAIWFNIYDAFGEGMEWVPANIFPEQFSLDVGGQSDYAVSRQTVRLRRHRHLPASKIVAKCLPSNS